MARLNEPPVSTDSIETLRRKLLRQNRDLAKSNNVRALRIRELENDCACMLSENLELRGRILELEKELEDNEARRIADHALAIKEKLESQLTEWGTLLAGLGLEPPMKRHSPRVRRSTMRPRLSFSSARPSPSQRRLRDIARDIEELGHISEQKSYPRMSMNPEQILALRSEADSIESPELGPPPMSQFIDEDPVKVDSPSRLQSSPTQETPKMKMEPPVALESPQSAKFLPRSPSPEKRRSLPAEPEEEPTSPTPPQQTPVPVPQPAKAGSKRKLAARDDMTTSNPQQTTENVAPRVIAEKQSIREKVGNKTLKELANSRKEAREKSATAASRKPLAAKSTNDDVASPKKMSKQVITDEVAAAKADLVKSKSKAKTPTPIDFEAIIDAEPPAPKVVDLPAELANPVVELAILSPSSPETASAKESSRGGTPPPVDFNGSREAPRPSRRNRAAVSYAEPNLRDKMRRPTKELLDAVSGEGKYVRRSSQAEPVALDSDMVKKENALPTSWKKLPPAPMQLDAPDNVPTSPLAKKGSAFSNAPQLVPMGKGRRTSMLINETFADSDDDRIMGGKANEPGNPDSSNMSEVDIYEFTTSSPQPEKETAPEPKKKVGGRRPPRRVSSAVTGDEGLAAKERAASRRRSMML